METSRQISIQDYMTGHSIPQGMRAIKRVPQLRTEALVLRRLHEEDAAQVLGYLSAPDAEFYDRKLPERFATPKEMPTGQSQQEMQRAAEEYIREKHEKEKTCSELVWGIQYQDLLIGQTNLHSINHEDDKARVGAIITPEWRDRRFAREALRRVVDFAFEDLKLNRLETHVYSTNGMSLSFVVGVGFRSEGTQRQAEKIQGVYVDVTPLSLVREDWEREQRPYTRAVNS